MSAGIYNQHLEKTYWMITWEYQQKHSYILIYRQVLHFMTEIYMWTTTES